MAKSSAIHAVQLSDVVRGIRKDLAEEAQRRRNAGEKAAFAIEDIEVELFVRFGDEVEAGGGVKAYVVDLFTKAKQTSESSHKIKLRIKPIVAQGSTVPYGRPVPEETVLGRPDRKPPKRRTRR
jgi:hypothetical protein